MRLYMAAFFLKKGHEHRHEMKKFVPKWNGKWTRRPTWKPWADGWVPELRTWVAPTALARVASWAGYHCKPNKYKLRKQCCGSGMYPGSEFFPSRILICSIPDPGSASKILSILTQKMVSSRSKIWSGFFISDPDPDFIPIPDPGSRGSKRHRIPDPQHCKKSKQKVCNGISKVLYNALLLLES